jgi:hypothetical protein
MRRRLSYIPSTPPQPVEDYRAVCIQGILDSLKDRMTFLELADLLGVSHEFVRERLTEHPERLVFLGKKYQVPRPVAVEFIQSVLSAPIRKRPDAQKPLLKLTAA